MSYEPLSARLSDYARRTPSSYIAIYDSGMSASRCGGGCNSSPGGHYRI
ncbi:hypothetical protein JW711_04735 [Candidatus Woesearchaeota archaeon]|nr:hypothetical protein [Candidatus Woesearchaeota archaeon]